MVHESTWCSSCGIAPSGRQKKSVPQRWLRRVTPLHALVHVPHCVSLVRRKHFSPSTFAVASPASGSDCTGRLLIGQCGYDGDGESGLTILQRAEDWNVKRIGGQSRVTLPTNRTNQRKSDRGSIFVQLSRPRISLGLLSPVPVTSTVWSSLLVLQLKRSIWARWGIMQGHRWAQQLIIGRSMA